MSESERPFLFCCGGIITHELHLHPLLLVVPIHSAESQKPPPRRQPDCEGEKGWCRDSTRGNQEKKPGGREGAGGVAPPSCSVLRTAGECAREMDREHVVLDAK